MLQYVSAAQRHLPELDSNPLTVWNFYARFSDVISGGGGGGGEGSRIDVAKCRLCSLFFGYRTTHVPCVTHLPPRAQVEFELGTDVTPYSSDLTTSHKSSLLQTCTTPTRKDSH